MSIDFLFLFEHTGYATEPFTKAGYTTAIVDTLNSVPNPRATYTLSWDILEKETELKAMAANAIAVFGFPPCTDLAVSGAKHFRTKKLTDPNYRTKAMFLFRSVERIAGTRPFLIENPVSQAATLWRKPDTIFNPFEFGGYLPEDDRHPDWPQYIKPRDAYRKKTCFWLGNGMKMPDKKPVACRPGWSNQTLYLGGKSARTKLIRSASPRGVFTAFAEMYGVKK